MATEEVTTGSLLRFTNKLLLSRQPVPAPRSEETTVEPPPSPSPLRLAVDKTLPRVKPSNTNAPLSIPVKADSKATTNAIPVTMVVLAGVLLFMGALYGLATKKQANSSPSQDQIDGQASPTPYTTPPYFIDQIDTGLTHSITPSVTTHSAIGTLSSDNATVSVTADTHFVAAANTHPVSSWPVPETVAATLPDAVAADGRRSRLDDWLQSIQHPYGKVRKMFGRSLRDWKPFGGQPSSKPILGAVDSTFGREDKNLKYKIDEVNPENKSMLYAAMLSSRPLFSRRVPKKRHSDSVQVTPSQPEPKPPMQRYPVQEDRSKRFGERVRTSGVKVPSAYQGDSPPAFDPKESQDTKEEASNQAKEESPQRLVGAQREMALSAYRRTSANE